MTMQEVIDEIKLLLTGNILELEIEDKTIEQAIKQALRELGRYWDETTLVTVPFHSCMDLSSDKFEEQVSSIVKVYRTQGLGDVDGVSTFMDPAYAQQWMLWSNGGTMYNLNDYILNFAAWQTVNQIRNNISTDMSFKEDRHNKKLYINNYSSAPNFVTIEYVPKLKKVEDIKSDYWTDILIKMGLAMTKILLGRIRTRFSQTNAIWGMDGEKLLEEGTTELKELRERLNVNSDLIYLID